MSFLLDQQSNFIALGAWNPAIFQHEWLKENFGEIIQDNYKLELVNKLNIGLSNLNPSFRLNYANLVIDPNQGHLIIIPQKNNIESLAIISKLALGIHEKLIHTPIFAAGSNFSFKLEKNEDFVIDKFEQIKKIEKFYTTLNENLKINSRFTRHSFSSEDCTINLTYDHTSEEKIIRINFDYQSKNSMEKAAKSLIKNYEYALVLCNKLVWKNENC